MREKLVAWLLGRLISDDAFVVYQGRIWRVHEVEISRRRGEYHSVITARGLLRDGR